MTDRTSLSADLAAEIREAVAKTARATPSPEGSAASAGEEDGARRPLHRAADHISPTVPPAARLSPFKRFVVRALRFLWRDQTAFNALTLESLQAMLAGLASQRRAVEAFDREMAEFRKDQMRRHSAVEEMKRILKLWERRMAIEDGRLSALEAAASVAGRDSAPAAPAVSPAAIPPGVYSLFEERFRGSPEEITEKQRSYLPLFAGLPGPVLDVGCGRGEFLRLLAGGGIAASGVESNPIAAAEARQSGVEVDESDALAHLTRRPAGSLGAVVALQVVEHWSPETIFRFLREARRALAAGGLLLLETINTDSLSAWRAFYLDPSHVRPVSPEALRFLAEAAGFGSTRIEWRAPIPADGRLEENTDNDVKLNRLLFGPQDYALVAYVPGATAEGGERESEEPSPGGAISR